MVDTPDKPDSAGTAGSKRGRGLSVPSNPAMALRRLNAQHAETNEEPPPGSNDKQTEKQSDKQTNNTTNLSMGEGKKPEGVPPDIATKESVSAAPQAVAPAAEERADPRNKQSAKQTNNTTNRQPAEAEPVRVLGKRDGRTLRMRQNLSDPEATIVTSFRLSAATMEALDEFCFRNRMRKQDVVQQALEAFIADSADSADDENEGS